MLQVAKSKKKQHVIAAKTTGVAEKEYNTEKNMELLMYLGGLLSITVMVIKMIRYHISDIALQW